MDVARIDASRKKSVATFLSKDEEKIRKLSETLEKSGSLTEGMVGILESFQGRLNKLDKTIMPVYDKTKQLTQLQENVDQTLTAMDRVIGYHHIADDVEPKLMEGPTGNIDGYMKLLDKLKAAVDFFRANNSSSIELSHVASSFDKGIDLLEKEFKNMLSRHSLQVPSTVVEKLIKEEVEEDESSEVSFPKEGTQIQHLSDDVVKTLNTIAKYVTGNAGKTEIMTRYATTRSYVVGRTLKAFMEAGSPKKLPYQSNFLQRPSPTKRQSAKRKENMPARGGRSAASKYSSTSLKIGEGVSDEQLEGSSVLMNSSIILLRLLQSEWVLMGHIVPAHYHRHVFAQLVESPIDYFVHRGEILHQNAQRQLSRFDYVTIVPMLKIIKQIDKLLPEYLQLLGFLDESSIYARLPTLVGILEKTAVKGMEDYITYIKGDSEKSSNLPKDGTVHELTTNTMWFFEQMLEYADTAGRLEVSQQGQYNVNEDEEARMKAVGSYVVRVLNALTLNMENKSHNYESPLLAAIFLMNNYHFIQETYTRNPKMLELLVIALPDIEEHYNTLIGNQRRAYQRGFNKLLSFLGHETISKPISKGQRQRLKDKFKGFNTELEELYRIQQHYSIPNSSLRQSVRNESSTLILLTYGPFYEDYSSADFTKNPEKYLKYTPKDVEHKISNFFDQGAD